jgi:transcriptional regulator with XRE-family HTH domain
MPEPTEGPTVLRIMLGTQLRRLRESRGISAQAAAKAIRGSDSKISRIELGRNAIREIDVLDLLTFYGVDPVEREQLLHLAEQANRPGWWHRFNDILPDWFQSYVGMEEAATAIRVYEPQLIPGLLQTQQYTAAVLAMCDIPIGEAERHVILRKERQRRFVEGRLKLWAIVEETALRRPIGSKEILRDQLAYLLSLTGRPNLTLQVIPDGTGGHAVSSGFTILRFEETDLPDIAYLEHLTSALYFDKKSDVDRYLMAMERLSIVSAQPGETRAILSRNIDRLKGELGCAHGGRRALPRPARYVRPGGSPHEACDGRDAGR